MQWLSRLSVRRPVFASVLMLTFVIIGAVGYGNLGVDKFPKIQFPMLVITTIYPGAAPTSVEKDVTEKIEAAVNTVSGIDVLSSITSEGASLVVVQFDLEKDADVAAQDVRDRINMILGELPIGVRPPRVERLDPDAAPVLMLSIKGAAKVERLTELAEIVVKRRLETVLGVGQVRIIGGQRRRIDVHLNPLLMHAAGVNALEVQHAIGVANVSVPGGRLEQGPQVASMRVEGRVGTPDQIGDLVVRKQGDNLIRVRDVAKVEDAVSPATSLAVRDGTEAVVLAVRKQSGANTVDVVDRARAAVQEIVKQGILPDGIVLEPVRDNSEAIRTTASQVQEHLVVGAILAAIVVLVFLASLRSTLIAAVSIPVSVIATFALMSRFGFSLNLMTLLALALAVGIVIDDAIVVLENIHRFIEEEGVKPFPAAVLATKQIGLAVLATTLSLMAVFLPVAFMGGIVGRFLASFGLTMAFAIGVSMLVAFTLTPMMAARMLKPKPAGGAARQVTVLERMVDRFYHPIERLYLGVLGWALRHRWVVVVVSLGVLFSSGPLAKKAGFGFLPENDEAQFEIYIEAAEGTSLEQTGLIAERIARKTRTLDGVSNTLTTVADDEQQRAHIAHVYVRLTHPDQRERSQEAVMDETRRKVLSDLPPGVLASAQRVEDFTVGGQNSTIAYYISGPDLDRLERYGTKVLDQLRKVPGVVDADTSLTHPIKEATVRPDFDRAALLGVDPGALTATMRLMVGGDETSKYEERGEQYDVFLRAEERFRTDTSFLGLITVPSATQGSVLLHDVVTIDQSDAPTQINRLSRTRNVLITCNVAPGADEGGIVTKLASIIEDLKLPPGYSSGPFARTKELARTQKAFAFAFLMSFIFMYLVLAAQFESWLHPFTIMLALPLTLPFALMSIILFGGQLNIFSMLGLLVLFGVVKKNAILQIDQANQLRAQGMERTPAILEANRHRLRPILMTTFAFVAGMIPLAFSSGIGAGFSKAMASIVIGGQTFSLALTLVAIPVFYSLFDDAGTKLGRLVGRIFNRNPVDRGRAELDAMNAPGG